MHPTGRLGLSRDLPVMITVVDSDENIQSLLPVIDSIVPEGLVVMSDVDVIKYADCSSKNGSRGGGRTGGTLLRARSGPLCRIQRGEQEFPEPRHRVKKDLLVWRVHPFERWTERNHVDAGIFLADDAALESGMDGLHRGFLAVERFERIDRGPQDRRIEVRLPTRIPVALFDAGASELEERADGGDDLL
jgi:hypothetical protein